MKAPIDPKNLGIFYTGRKFRPKTPVLYMKD